MYLTQSQLTPAKEPRRVLKGGVSTTAPQPGLGSGSSPPIPFNGASAQSLSGKVRHQRAVEPKFQGIPPNAMSQFTLDLLGVWAPKLPLTRSKAQLFEDAFLENVENGAFYFAIPLTAPLFAKGINWLSNKVEPQAAGKLATEQIGSSWKALGTTAEKATVKMVGAKMGALLAVLSFAAGYEYMIQHVKNVITAKKFNTKNFTAVAGLEAAKLQAQAGEMDPVEKTKRRAWQVGGLMAGTFGLAAAMPYLAKNSKFIEKLSKKVLTYVNFSSGKGHHFDITKPLLAILAGIGAVSYIDASRDHLERKENATRLAFVIPYMLFGKEMAGNLLASLLQNSKLDIGDENHVHKKKIKDILGEFKDSSGKPLSFLEQENIWNPKVLFNKFISNESPMNVGMFRSSLGEELEKIPVSKLSGPIKEAISNRLFLITIGSYGLSALACGLGINWLAYQQTKERYKRQQEQLKLQQPAMVQPATQNGFALANQAIAAPGFGRAPQASPFAFPGNLQGQAGQFNRFSYR